MDSSSKTIRKTSLLLPAILVCSLFSGLTLGAVITYQFDPTIPSTPATKQEDVSTPSNMARKQTEKEPKTFTTIAAVADPALQYLNGSKQLSYDSKQLTGFLHYVHLDRPEWSWSRSELKTNYAPMNSLFGQSAATEVLTEVQPVVAAKTSTVVQLTEPPAIPERVSTKTIGKQKGRLVVALDPGHGGTDPGSEAHNGLVEKELTLDMAKRVELFLSEIDNVDVIMTRNSDTGMSRQSRVDTIKAANADVVVSLHFNHLPQTNVNLVESFYADKQNVIESLRAQNRPTSSVNLDFTSASKNLANIMHDKVYNEVASVNENVVNAGVKNETLFVLTRSFAPGVLLELTCISNPAEADRLASVEYRDQLAASIADGLRDYLLSHHSDQFSEILANLDSPTKPGQKL